MRAWISAAVGCGLLLGACTAKYPEGVIWCNRAADCPDGWNCRLLEQHCYSTPRSAAAGARSEGGSGGAAGKATLKQGLTTKH